MKGSTLEKKNSRIGWTMVIIASVQLKGFTEPVSFCHA